MIAWNLWQMDGLKGTVPLGEPEDHHQQVSMFDLFGSEMGFETDAPKAKKTPRCKIYDWRADNAVLFEAIGRENVK